MKTKHTNKLLVLIISVMMIVTLFAGLSITASAEETGTTTPVAEISGKQINLGGDISMKYYVKINDQSVTPAQLKLLVTFLGKQTEITNPTEKNGEYIFTFEGITPQCMGDQIDAVLYANGEEVDSLLDYSVQKNLENTYKNTSDENLKCLILDTLKYGKAAQIFKDYKTDAFVTDGELADEIAYDFDNTGFYNQGHTYTGATDDIHLAEEGGITVNFSNVNTLKFKYVAPEGTKVTINGEEVTPTKEGDYWIVETNAIAPTGFYDLYTVVIADTVTVTYSVNEYCGFTFSNSSNPGMTELALALYNYGYSAHIYDGTGHLEASSATCYYHAVCKICWHEYGDLLPHNYTYTEDQASATITESCDQGCGHKVSVTLHVPQNAVYNGNEQPATLTYTGGTALKGATPTIVYHTSDGNAPVNPGNYMAVLNVVSEAGYYSVAVPYPIYKATPEVTAPTANDLTYNGTAQALVTAGTTTGGTLVYSLTGADGSFSETIPTATDVGEYFVYYYVQGDDNHDDTTYNYIPVTIKKATPDVTAPTGLTATYGDTLADVVLHKAPGGTAGTWSWNDGNTTSVGNAGTQIFKATFTPTDSTNYNTVEVELTIAVAKATVTVTVNAQVKTYGEADPELTYTVSGLIGSDTVTGALARAEGENAGTYAINLGTLSAGDNYTINFVGADLTITKKNASGATVELGEYNSVYDGNAKTPAVTVTLDGNTLVKDTDYTVTYTNNVYVGTATVTVTFKGNYEGTVTKTFEIAQDPNTTEFDGEWVTIPKA